MACLTSQCLRPQLWRLEYKWELESSGSFFSLMSGTWAKMTWKLGSVEAVTRKPRQGLLSWFGLTHIMAVSGGSEFLHGPIGLQQHVFSEQGENCMALMIRHCIVHFCYNFWSKQPQAHPDSRGHVPHLLMGRMSKNLWLFKNQQNHIFYISQLTRNTSGSYTCISQVSPEKQTNSTCISMYECMDICMYTCRLIARNWLTKLWGFTIPKLVFLQDRLIGWIPRSISRKAGRVL